ncbi:ferredoxin--NADP reductase [Alphaproteobacteria bacterium]|nr:ferredoxin--NADP reductase [Alphaproteobacteria bacterium]
MSKFEKNYQKVTYVKHWTDNLFSFKITRPASFKFRSGEFVMIGLPDISGKPILRAYSIASPSWSEELEFYSIIVENGPLTSKLKNIKINDDIILMPKSTGTLVLDALKPGKRLFLISSGTGFAPFASLIREPEAFEKYENVIVTHTCRTIKELEYSKEIIKECKNDELIKDFISNKLITYHSTTREYYENQGRITDLILNKTIFNNLKIEEITSNDRVMLCGSMGLNNDLKEILSNLKLNEGANNNPAEFVLEKAFVG